MRPTALWVVALAVVTHACDAPPTQPREVSDRSQPSQARAAVYREAGPGAREITLVVRVFAHGIQLGAFQGEVSFRPGAFELVSIGATEPRESEWIAANPADVPSGRVRFAAFTTTSFRRASAADGFEVLRLIVRQTDTARDDAVSVRLTAVGEAAAVGSGASVVARRNDRVAAPVTASALQSVVVLKAGSGSRVQVAPGAKLEVPLQLDMSAAGGVLIASLTSTITWGASRLTFDSVKAGAFGMLTANTTNAATGSVNISVFDAAGSAASAGIGTLYFTAAAGIGSTRLTLAPTAAGSNAGASIQQMMRVMNLGVCVAPTSRWGDVNGDAAVSIVDAQQIARFSVGLSVGNEPLLATVGDVTSDNVVSIIDAQQIARFTVALPAAPRVNTPSFTPPDVATIDATTMLAADAGGANPSAPANLAGLIVGQEVKLVPVARDALGTDITECVASSYISNAAGVASVNSIGVVTAVSEGIATITVGAGLMSTPVNATVGSAGGPFQSVSAGSGFTCGHMKDGTARCWGANFSGQIGNASTTESLVAAPVSGGRAFSKISAGSLTACGVTPGGELYCWGDLAPATIGATDFMPVTVPTRVVGGTAFTAVFAGDQHHCAIAVGGAAYCWGNNSAGQLGNGFGVLGPFPNSDLPVAVAGGLQFTTLSVGAGFTCGLTAAGAAYCWGSNGFEQLGNGTEGGVRQNPGPVVGGLTFTTIATPTLCCKHFTVGVTAAGAVYRWGNGPTSPALYWPSNTPLASLAPGRFHDCGLTSAGVAYCWGSNSNGQLGDGTTTSRANPTLVAGGLTWAMLSAGGEHTCGVTTNGYAYCWGVNAGAQLGDGTKSSRAVPTPVVLQ